MHIENEQLTILNIDNLKITYKINRSQGELIQRCPLTAMWEAQKETREVPSSQECREILRIWLPI